MEVEQNVMPKSCTKLFHRIDIHNLGFISEDKLYKYNINSGWLVGDAGSNYFGNYTDMTSTSLAFYSNWVWVFRGNVSYTDVLIGCFLGSADSDRGVTTG